MHAGIFEPLREVECLERARISLEEAIAIAQQNGGTVVDADYRQDEELGCLRGKAGAYDITVADGPKITTVSIDAASGKPDNRELAEVMSTLFEEGLHFEGSPSDMARIAPALSISMSEAVERAKSHGGMALSAWIDRNGQTIGYAVKIVQQGRVHTIWIDAT